MGYHKMEGDMRHIVNDSVPDGCVGIRLDDGKRMLLEHFMCNGTMVALIDPTDLHRVIVPAERMKEVVR